ncbi:MAG: hypothetical protein ACREO3_07375 [Arenimonas sp.]
MLIVVPALACENETGRNRFGKSVDMQLRPRDVRDALAYKPLGHDRVEWARRVTADAQSDPSYENLNELAVVLLRFGRLPEAIRLLHFLDARFPGRYPTATNLGTAYELAGEDAKALGWIREGIRRNPSSHDGSEWVHALILEAKVAGTAASGGSLLALDYGRAPMVAVPSTLPAGNDGKPLDAKELSWHLFLQLSERTQYVPPHDPVVASLLFDWASNEMAEGTLETADAAYDLALKYGHPKAAVIALRRVEIKRILASAED